MEFDQVISSMNRTRDVVMKVIVNGTNILVCIENQTYVRKDMPFHVFEYDYAILKRQVKSAKDYHQPMPVVTLVLYYGENHWNYSQSLYHHIPYNWMNYIEAHPLLFFDMKEANYQLCRDQDTRDLIEGLQKFYKLKSVEALEGMYIDKDIAIILSTLTHVPDLMKIVKEEKGETIYMCKAVDRLMKQNKEEGRSEGQISLVINMLKTKFGFLSEDIEIEIQKSTPEQIHLLSINIFKVDNENDVMSLLNC